MRWWTLILWVTQFGLSALFPLCFFLLIGAWLQNAYDLGGWVYLLCGIVGLLTSIRTVRSCYRSMRKDADAACEGEQKTPVFNDHD